MKTKVLAEGQYVVSSIIKDGEDEACPIEDSPLSRDSTFCRSHAGLMDVIERIAKDGLQQFPASLSHSINKDPKIYELIRGRLRLIYFHGCGNFVVICIEIVVKKTQKADRQVISRAIQAHNNYHQAVSQGTLEIIRGEDEN